MQFRVLGSVDILGEGGVVQVPGARRRSVLATLALRAGEVVSIDKIVDAVWDEAPPATARNTVQAHVSALRKIAGSPEVITAKPPGYVLTAPSPATDLVAVHALIGGAERADGPAERVRLLGEALSYWRGTSLADTRGSTYLARHADSLDQLRITTHEDLLMHRLRLADHQAAIPDLETLVAENPYRERPVQLLMTALYRAGRTSDALAVYSALGATLREELGLEPDLVTASVHRRILQRDVAMLVPADPARRPTAPLRPTPLSVPASVSLGRDLGRLFGREAELVQGRDLLEGGRLLTIVGMGGVGKTRLAWELVRDQRSRGGTCLVVDVTAARPEQLLDFVAASLAVPNEPGVDTAAALGALLEDTVLLLDNTDHVVDAAADLVADLLTRSSSVQVVVTSREPLHLDGEDCLLVAPLRTPDALRLLTDRAHAADPAFRLGPHNEAALAGLCQELEGLPLALEILGPRLRSHTVPELVAGLDRRLLTWRDARRQVSDRHRSVGSLMDETFAVLGDSEVSALESLSWVYGGAWLDEAALLCDPDPDRGEDLIVALLDRSLLVRTEVDRRTRVTMHSLVRAYTREQVTSAGRDHELRVRHARWVRALVSSAALSWHTADEPAELRRRRVDDANLRAALEWHSQHSPEQLAGFVVDLWWYWFRVGDGAEGRRWALLAVDGAPPDSWGRARAHAAAGYLAWLLDDYDDARAQARAALASPGADAMVTGFAHGVMARALGDAGEFDEAARAAQRGVDAYVSGGDAWGAAWLRRVLASALLYGGRIEESAEPCRRSHSEFAAVGDEWGVGGTLDLASRIAAQQGNEDEARDLAASALQSLRSCGDTSGERYALQHLAESHWAMGELEEASEYAAAGLDLAVRHGYQVGALQALLLLGDVAAARADAATAAEWRERAELLVARLGPAAEVSLEIAADRRAARRAAQRPVEAGSGADGEAEKDGTSAEGSG